MVISCAGGLSHIMLIFVSIWYIGSFGDDIIGCDVIEVVLFS